MRVEESFRNAVRVIVMVYMFVMAPMFARPHQNRVFKRSGAKNKCEQSNRPTGLEAKVREEPMVTDGDAQAAGPKHSEEECDLKPVEPEIVQIKRDSRQR